METESKRGFLLFEHDWLLQHMKASHRHTDPRTAIDVLEREDKEKLQNKQDGEEKLSKRGRAWLYRIHTPEEIHICNIAIHNSK